jgi:hypothetical protein
MREVRRKRLRRFKNVCVLRATLLLQRGTTSRSTRERTVIGNKLKSERGMKILSGSGATKRKKKRQQHIFQLLTTSLIVAARLAKTKKTMRTHIDS